MYNVNTMGTPNDFKELVNIFINLLNSIIPLLFAVILLIFTWKIIDAWVLHAGDENKVAEGKKTLLVGLIAFVVLSGIWGILAVIQSSLFIG